MKKLVALTVEAKVFDDGILGVKMPVDLEPGTYTAALVVNTHREEPRAVLGPVVEPLARFV